MALTKVKGSVWDGEDNGQALSVKDYGAVGDGVADDAAAVQLAFDAAKTAVRAHIHFPAGRYKLGSQVVLSSATAGWLTVSGDGPDATKIIVPDTNLNGAISIDYTGVGDEKKSITTIRDLSVVADGESLGTAIKINNVEGGNLHRRNAYIMNVEVRGEAIATDYFDTGINLTGCWRPLINGVIVGGPFGTGVSTDLTDASYLYKMAVGINIDDCYGPEIINSYVWSATTAVSCTSDATVAEEGFRISNTNIVGVKTGIKFTRTTEEPSFWLSNVHINYRDQGIDMDGCKLVRIAGLISYNEDTGDEYNPGVAADILMDNVTDVIIQDSMFHFAGATDRIGVQLGTTSADGISILNNIFSGTFATAIHISTVATRVLISNNEYPGTITTKVNDTTSLATILERTGNSELSIESQADGANAGPNFVLYRNSASPAAADSIGQLVWGGRHDGSVTSPGDIDYAVVKAVVDDATENSEDASLQLFVAKGGTVTRVAEFDGTTTAGNTSLLVFDVDNNTVERVSVGAADSGGTNFKVLRIPN